MLKFLFIIDRSDHVLDIDAVLNPELHLFILTNDIHKSSSNYSFLKNVSYHKFDSKRKNIHLFNFMMYVLKTYKNFNIEDVYSHEILIIDSEYEYLIYEPTFKYPKFKNLSYFGNKYADDIKLIWFDRILDFFYFSLFESYCESFPKDRIPEKCDFKTAFLLDTFAFRANIKFQYYA